MNFISHIVGDSNFVRLKGLGFENLHLKLESCNPAGSIKMKTAIGLIDSYAERRLIHKDTVLIESSSGNLGVALAMICASMFTSMPTLLLPSSRSEMGIFFPKRPTERVMLSPMGQKGWPLKKPGLARLRINSS